MLLHEKGSSNQNNTKTETDKMKFHPSFSVKDLLPGTLISILFLLIISNTPNLLGDVENFNPANPLVTPVHIQPEWYFLFAYVILRSIPSKIGGVVALAASIMILAILVIKKKHQNKIQPNKKNSVLAVFINRTDPNLNRSKNRRKTIRRDRTNLHNCILYIS